VKNRLYTLPELNETLYLHFSCFQRIGSLDPYVNLTSLWLNNNAINVIEELSSLTKLVCLYLQGNVIERIDGLDALVNLETLVLSSNYIKKIENLGRLTKLHTLDLDHNYISDPANLQGVLEVPSVGVLNIAHNKLETEGFLPVVSQMANLNLLKLEGNPIARTMSQYRRRLLNAMPRLRYLDDQPVTDTELRCAIAWGRGGRDAEMEERQAIRQEKEDERARSRRELRRRNRQFAIDHGIDISKDKFLMSSDDERLKQESDEDEAKQEEPTAAEEDQDDAPRTIEVVEDDDAGDEEDVVENRAGVADNYEDVDAVE
jgi:dynein assembly factor 1